MQSTAIKHIKSTAYKNITESFGPIGTKKGRGEIYPLKPLSQQSIVRLPQHTNKGTLEAVHS